MSDLPEPVGMSANVSRPAMAARTTSSCPGRKASKPKSSRSGETRSVRRASIGTRSGDACAEFATTSRPADLDRARPRLLRKPVVRELVPVGRLPGVDVSCDAKARWCVERACCDADPLAVGRLPEEARSALGAEGPARVSYAVRAVDPAERRRLADREVLDARRGEGARRSRTSAGTRRSGR